MSLLLFVVARLRTVVVDFVAIVFVVAVALLEAVVVVDRR